MDTLGPALQSLLSIAEQRLIDCECPVGLATLAPGNTVAWDNCCEACEGGELWVRAISIVPQPQPSQPCDITHLQARVGLGIVRCMHCIDSGNGIFPTAEEMTGDTLQMTRDADALLTAIREWPGTNRVAIKSLRVETGTPLGPQGCCGGWEWTLAFHYLMCEGC